MEGAVKVEAEVKAEAVNAGNRIVSDSVRGSRKANTSRRLVHSESDSCPLQKLAQYHTTILYQRERGGGMTEMGRGKGGSRRRSAEGKRGSSSGSGSSSCSDTTFLLQL